MSLRTRLVAVLVFAALFVAVPAPSGASGRAASAWLQVRTWLLADDSPLAAWAQDGALPALAVDLRPPPPLGDGRTPQPEDYARTALEWAASRATPAAPLRVDPARGALPLVVLIGEHGVQAEVPQPQGPPARLLQPFPSRLSLLPALLAVALAVLTGRVLPALSAAGLAGAVVHVATAVPGAGVGPVDALLDGVRHFAVDALWQRAIGEDFHLRVTAFVVLLFMTVGVLTANGGLHGLVVWLQQRVRGPVGAQLATFVGGLAICFDDYTSCLVVGAGMRPLADAERVSREKLAYIVDSTAAPIAGLSLFSTWVVYEMSQYRGSLPLVTRADGTPYATDDAFAVFVASLPFRCYCLFALATVVLVIVLRRDFGPMLAAERRARRAAPAPLPVGGPAGGRARNAALPLLVLIGGTVALLLHQGLAAASPDRALLAASAAALVTAIALTLGQRLLSPAALVRTMLRSTRVLWLPLLILFLAWALGHVCRDLGTSFFLTAGLRGAIPPLLLPLVLFVVAAAVAFATGTSFGTMAILLPNVVVLAHQAGADAAFAGSAAAGGPAMMLLCIGAVLEGAIFGDHCSPISDTTVLSAISTQCDLLAHVATQLPYALLAFGVSVGCGYLPLAWFGPEVWPWCLLGGVAVLATVLRLLGRPALA